MWIRDLEGLNIHSQYAIYFVHTNLFPIHQIPLVSFEVSKPKHFVKTADLFLKMDIGVGGEAKV